jgi:glutamine synthetase
MVKFRYVGGDGRLKTLDFVISGPRHLDSLLSSGERVDGSSLFSYIDAASSDLYVVPRYRTAFLDPFAEIPTLDILCAFYTSAGERLPSSPENVARRAQEVLQERTGFTVEAMGELEYYILSERQPFYPITAQKGYHESAPFSKWEKLRAEAMAAVAQAGGAIKYGHSETGHIRGEDHEMAQHEIEFLPVPIADAADQIVIAKWILSVLGLKHGVRVSFAPKISVGHAGSGLHVHARLMKNGRNVMVAKGALSEPARKLIAGWLTMAPSLTAFGNTVPTSYLRLVPHQEAPTNVCWGERNRSTLVRVPLGWLHSSDMLKDANPREKADPEAGAQSQTVEFRAPDGSAQIHLLMAGLAVAARHGLGMRDALAAAKRLHVDGNVFSAENKALQAKLPQLPASCAESAERLLADRRIYEAEGVFSPVVIDGMVRKLQAYSDRDLSERLFGKEEEIKKLVDEFLYC